MHKSLAELGLRLPARDSGQESSPEKIKMQPGPQTFRVISVMLRYVGKWEIVCEN